MTSGPTLRDAEDGHEAILRVRDVTVRFGGVVALRGVDLSVQPGQVCGLIGPNGAGKTTLFDVIAGLRYPTEGQVLLGGEDVTRRTSTWRARQGVRRTFQRQQTFGWLSVEDNLLAAMEWHGGGGGVVPDLLGLPSRKRHAADRRRRAVDVLELCGIAHLRAEMAGRLPIGQARMVELARAIVDRPRLLLLDEPTSGLEHREADQLGRIVQDLRRETQCAVLLVEHDVQFVVGQCDRVVVLNLGAVLAQGDPASIQADERVREAYLG